MSTPKFTLKSSYKPGADDLFLLLYADHDSRLFAVEQLPKAVKESLKAPAKPGAQATIFRGVADGKSLLALGSRLDKAHSNPRLETKKAVAASFGRAKSESCKRIIVPLSRDHDELVTACHEGALLGGYRYDEYLSDKPQLAEVVVVTPKGTDFRTEVNWQKMTCDCINFARDLLNEPPNDLKPPLLAEKLTAFGTECGLKVTVWDEKRLLKENCGGVLGVGMGSDAKPRMVIADYKPTTARAHICLVGKGVTFDTGGYGLKPADSQIGMKYDMGGAAMMFAATCAIALHHLPARITCITPLVENMISGRAYHTTSILCTRSGKTVEVMNTDAEGRLILADALTLAEEKKPDWIIDAATLTGATVVALGEDIAGVYGNSQDLITELIRIGKEEDEIFWQLPLHQPYAEKLKTTIADVKNRGDRWGGGITAALFLKEFISDDTKWIHIDIAGPGGKETSLDHLGKGAKGFGVKSIVSLVHKLVAQ